MSDVAVSFESPEYTADADGMGALRILEANRILGLVKKTRFYQATTSELYGLVQEIPQKETTPFYPRSPYAGCKVCAVIVKVDPRYFRPTKAKDKLGGVPQIALQEKVTEMVATDLADFQRQALPMTHGYATTVSSEH